jgi:DtxR family transcriptional regulator, Mn-dependent transcriptional regulator
VIHPTTDEVLERLWHFKEQQRSAARPQDLGLAVTDAELDKALQELRRNGAVEPGQLALLPPGEERARGIVRRHRLAEILFTQVLEAAMHEAEASACEFEHMLSESVVDRVCTFLGHPPKCPHGKAIPEGNCCRKFERTLEPLIRRLADVPIGSTGTIAFIVPRSAGRLNRLAALGILPGTSVRLVQRRPAFVIAVGETTVALEEEIADEMYVRS